MIYFLLGFTQVALVSAQSRNYSQSRYKLSFLCSVLISLVWWVSVNMMIRSTPSVTDGIGYILGNSLGGVAGIWVQKKLASKKDVSEW